jgi:hypothetical protein
MKIFWYQSWASHMLPDLPWNQLNWSVKRKNCPIVFDPGQKGIGLVNDSDNKIWKCELVAGRILQYIGEEFGIILVKRQNHQFHHELCCVGGKYINEDYDVKEHLYVGKKVQAVVDYKIEVNGMTMALSVSGDGKLDLMRPISPRLLLKGKFQEAMREEWLSTLPNGNLGRSLKDPLQKYIVLKDQ